MQSKKRILDLAILGGKPAFAEKLHVGRPNLGDRARLLERFNDMLDRHWLSNDGPYVQELERRIAAFVGVRHCVATCNATIALEIAIKALGLSGEVIVPSFSFVATAHALQWQNVTPVFCDVSRDTHNLDPAQVEALLSEHTSGIIGVHVWGRSCEVDTLAEIAQQHHLKLLFDAAHAFACSHGDRMLGGCGDAEVFSFHATKFFNTFEGGAIVTQNDELAARCRLMRNFGFAGYDEVVTLGTNGKMSEAAAIMGLTGLESLEEFIAVNQRNYRLYWDELEGIPGIRPITLDSTGRSNYQYVVLEISKEITQISRDHLLKILWAENVLARRYFYPGCHRMEPYRTLYPQASDRLPETERLTQRVLIMPTGMSVDSEQVQTMCAILRFAVSHGGELSHRLSESALARH